MSITVESKAGLIGYLQGSIKGTISTVKNAVEAKDNTKAELEHYLKITLKQLQKALNESEELWNEVKYK